MTGKALRRKLSPMGMTAAEWAALLGVSDKTIYRMYKASDVRTEMVERICRALDKPLTFFYETDGSGDDGKGTVSASLIRIKRKEEQSEPPQEPHPIELTFNLGKKVSELLVAQHRKMSDLVRYMGVTYPTVTHMCAKNSCSLASLTKIADFFKVPITYFLPTDLRAMEEAEKDRQINFLKGQIAVYQKALSTLLNSDQ